MCGNIGVVNREKLIMASEKLLKFFYQGLYCDAVRGQHGTGICAVDDDGVIRTFKRALTSSDFLELSTAKKIMSDNDNVFLMGHNRHATTGNHTTENTHPFTNDNITLFHNGTLTSHKELNPGKAFTVDSDAISYLISNSEDKIGALEKLTGAFALVWYDSTDQTINFARNDERTFYIGKLKDSKSLVYSSEAGLIHWLCARNNIEVEEVAALVAGKLVSIPLDPNKEVVVTPFTPYIAKSVTYPKYDYYNYASNKQPVIPGVKVNDVVVVVPLIWTPYNAAVTSPSSYGNLSCGYKDGITFDVSGVRKTEVEECIDKLYNLQVLSIRGEKQGFGKLLQPVVVTDKITIEKGKVIAIQTKKVEEKLVDSKSLIEGSLKRLGYTPLTEDERNENPWDSDYDDFSVVKGPGRTYITETEYLKRTIGGCANCTDDLLLEDAEKIKWDFEGNPYCPECAIFYNIQE